MKLFIGQRLQLGFLGTGTIILIDEGMVTIQGYCWNLDIEFDTLYQILVS